MVIFCLGYWFGQKSSTPKPSTPSPSPSSPTASPQATSAASPQNQQTSNWPTYVNQRFNYSLQYPPQATLAPLGEGDNPFSPDIIEVGDEGTFIEIAQTQGLDKSMVVTGIPLPTQYQNSSLEDIVTNHGSFIEPCHQAQAQKVEAVTTTSGLTGYKAWYHLVPGCQGAGENQVNDPFAFFDARPQSQTIIKLFENKMDEHFDTIVSTFQFTAPIEYGD